MQTWILANFSIHWPRTPILPTSIIVTMGSKKYVFVPCYSPFDWINEELDNANLMPFLDEHLHIHVGLNSWCHNCGSSNWLCARIKIRFKCPTHIHIQFFFCITHLYPSIGVHVNFFFRSSRIMQQCLLNILIIVLNCGW